MPSSRHDDLVRIFLDRPAVVAELLREFAGRELPGGNLVALSTADLNDRPSADLIPDTVFAVGQARDPRHIVVVEVQHAATADKHLQMARYAAALWLFYRCRVTALVFCPEQKVADFYTEPLATGLEDYLFYAVALGPSRLPVITDPEQIAARPDIAAVALAAHPSKATIRAFFEGLRGMSPEAINKYIEDAHRICGPDARTIMEEVMPETTWVVSTPFAKEHFGRGKAEGFAEGLAAGEAQGIAEGRTAGRTEGRTEGRIGGEAQALLTVLGARFVLSDDHVLRVLGCTELEMLDLWLLRAATVEKIEDVFDPEPAKR